MAYISKVWKETGEKANIYARPRVRSQKRFRQKAHGPLWFTVWRNGLLTSSPPPPNKLFCARQRLALSTGGCHPVHSSSSARRSPDTIRRLSGRQEPSYTCSHLHTLCERRRRLSNEQKQKTEEASLYRGGLHTYTTFAPPLLHTLDIERAFSHDTFCSASAYMWFGRIGMVRLQSVYCALSSIPLFWRIWGLMAILHRARRLISEALLKGA